MQHKSIYHIVQALCGEALRRNGLIDMYQLRRRCSPPRSSTILSSARVCFCGIDGWANFTESGRRRTMSFP